MESTMPTDSRHFFLEEHTATSQPFRLSKDAPVFVPTGTSTIDIEHQPPPASSHRDRQDTPATSISAGESAYDDEKSSEERGVETENDEQHGFIANTDASQDRPMHQDIPGASTDASHDHMLQDPLEDDMRTTIQDAETRCNLLRQLDSLRNGRP